jgi:hypothetical protein
MLRISLYSYPKRYVFLIIAYVLSSTKLWKRAEQLLLAREGMGVRWWRQGAQGRDVPNNVCTYE